MRVSKPRSRTQRSQYRILGLVGQGQFGRVFCALHRRTGHLVALKHLEAHFPTHQFLRELRLMLSLQHPNIVTCRTIEHCGRGRYLVMDYCEGGTLRSRLDTALLNPLQAVQLVCDILAGLEHAHSHNIVHCDLKPDNILLTIASHGWSARLSDFGIARLIQDGYSGSGQTGSPAYMAPERFFGQYSPRSDLYSVGVILFELLTGDRPFSGVPLEVMSAHVNCPLVLPDTIPLPLRSIVQKALQKLPARRFSSAAQMQADLLAAIPQLECPQVARPQFSSPTTIAVQSVSDRVEQLAVSETQCYWTTLTAEGAKLHWGENAVCLPAPVRSLLLRPQGCFVQTETALYLQPHSGSALRLVAASANAQVAIAPNGNWIATVSPNLFTLHSQCGQMHQIGRAAQPGFCEAIVLDSRHCLVLQSSIDTRSTQIEVWTRHGQQIACFRLATAIKNITAATPNRLLGIAHHQPNRLLLIDVQPFRVQQIELAIEPYWIVPLTSSSVCIDRQGQIARLDWNGQLLEYSTGPTCPTAVAANVMLSRLKSDLQVATWRGNRAELHWLRWSHSEQADR